MRVKEMKKKYQTRFDQNYARFSQQNAILIKNIFKSITIQMRFSPKFFGLQNTNNAFPSIKTTKNERENMISFKDAITT